MLTWLQIQRQRNDAMSFQLCFCKRLKGLLQSSHTLGLPMSCHRRRWSTPTVQVWKGPDTLYILACPPLSHMPHTSHAGPCSLPRCASGPQACRQAAPSARATFMPMVLAAPSCQGILLLGKLLRCDSVLQTAKCTYAPEAGVHAYLADDTAHSNTATIY